MDQYLTIVEHKEYAKRMEDEHYRQNKRIEILEENYKQLTELTMSVREQTMIINTMSQEIKRQGEQISKIVNEPANRWQRIKDKAIDTVVGVIVGALIVAVFVLITPYIQ